MHPLSSRDCAGDSGDDRPAVVDGFAGLKQPVDKFRGAAGALAREPLGDDEGLLGVALEGEIDDRPAQRRQLDCARTATLYDGDIAGGEVFLEAGHITAYVHAGRSIDRRGIEAGAADHDHARVCDACANARVRGNATAQ